MDVAFTAGMEEKLDQIEEGTMQWQAVLARLLRRLQGDLAKAEVDDARRQARGDRDRAPCEKCGKPMVIKWGRMGEFLACSGYPECKNTKDFKRGEDGSIGS